MPQTLQLILVLLGTAVVVVVLCRLIRLPPILGYLAVGIAVGPHALAWVPDSAETRLLAEFGLVFLMFSIGLEFSLPQLRAMRRAVFGLGLAQVAITTIAAMIGLQFLGYGWQAGFALGGALAMSSTAIVSKMLAERMELAAPHGRDVMGILLFQDLAVVLFLILLPSLNRSGPELALAIGLAFVKAVGGAGADPVRGTAADARVVPPRRAAAQFRALHAQPAADHAGPRGDDRACRAVAGAGRVPGRDADRRDRVPLPGRGGHQALPRRAAGLVLHHHGHGARPVDRRRELGLGGAAAGGAGAGQAGADRAALPPVRRRAGNGLADRIPSRAGGRVRAGDAGADAGARSRRADARPVGAGGDGAVDAGGACSSSSSRSPSCAG